MDMKIKIQRSEPYLEDALNMNLLLTKYEGQGVGDVKDYTLVYVLATEWMAMPFISSEQKGVYMYDRAGPQGLGRGLLGKMMNSWNLKSLKCFVGMCINGLKLHEVDLGWRHWLLNALIKHPQPSLPSSLLTEPQFSSGSDVPSSGDK